MPYVSEVNKIARQILDKMNESESTNGKSVVAEYSTGRVERFLCPVCAGEVGVNDTECSECHSQLS